ncbi:ATP-binding protein [Spirochaeta cellobiosiphila]|uniref:ATP-binding protein n=1 Tax=Spirochaeta cellobiosiphila TaxID=504483 RepID=UPI000417B03D|nr:sensor histidine kinase [Spirochaeta cellobiosiphila]
MHYSLCDFLMDAVQNSIEAEASLVNIRWEESERELCMSVVDNGCGMSEQELAMALDPFWTNGKKHSKRKVGLGLPFLMQTLDMTGGVFKIQSQLNKGTVLEAVFNREHVDTPPLGDFMGAFFSCLTLEGEHEMIIQRICDHRENNINYTLVRSELKAILGDLNDAANLGLLKDFICSQEENN